MTHIVAGGAGFIGVNLVRRLQVDGHRVVVLDNLCRGSREYLDEWAGRPGFEFHEVDLSVAGEVTPRLATVARQDPGALVWHLAANSDIPAGVADPNVDFRDTFLTTYHLVNSMREAGLKRLNFASTSAIYGDLGPMVLKEDVGPLFPISNYGAMKLASEAFLSAAAENGFDRVLIYRFPNVIGVPATHGVLLDFARKLKADRGRLVVLGNGTQQKGYLHVTDLVDAMIHLSDTVTSRRDVFNIGAVDDGVSVREIAEDFVALTAPGARVEFGKADRGWVGDVPRFRYSVDKLLATDWRPRLDSRGAMARAMKEIAAQEGLF